MFYPYKNKQTIKQWLFNTLDPRVWFRDWKECECSWDYIGRKLFWIPLAGCPKHD